ncbi:hypothetical protein BST61_g7315 [Cercospora zeina]
MNEIPEGFFLVVEHKTGKYYRYNYFIHTDPGIRMCRKSIEPGKMTIEIHKSDLYTDGEKAVLGEEGNKKDDVPWQDFSGYAYAGHQLTQIVILVEVRRIPCARHAAVLR